MLDSTSSSSAQEALDATIGQGSHGSGYHRGSDLKFETSSETTQRGSAPATVMGYHPLPTSQASVTSIVLPLGRGTPRQLVELILFFNSWTQASSFSVHRQGF